MLDLCNLFVGMNCHRLCNIQFPLEDVEVVRQFPPCHSDVTFHGEPVGHH